MRCLVDACYAAAAAAVSPLVVYRALKTGKYRQGWRERLGHVPQLPARGPGAARVWIHAVSVGEMNAARGLVQAWRARCPDHEIIVSATTDTGIARARQIFPGFTVIRYPLDFSRSVARALDRIRPDLIVLVELEVWYQFVTMAAERGIPVTVMNGRLSERSVRRFGYVRPLVRRMFSSLAWVGAQDEAYADRFRRMGVPPDRVTVTSSLKWDTAELVDHIPGSETLAAAMGLDDARALWVCGSTGPGEERVILRAYRQLLDRHAGLQLVLVPRKPERFDEVAELISAEGFTPVRRTRHPDGAPATPPPDAVHLGDTMGELRKFYTLADVVFVGRSLAPMGGSDMMEVAALGKPIIVGPHNENFADTVQQLQSADAIRMISAELEDVGAADRLAESVEALLADRQVAAAIGQRGRAVVVRNRGATGRTLDALLGLLGHSSRQDARESRSCQAPP